MKTNRETPSWLSNKFWTIAADHVRENSKYDIKILEPSAGEGNLLQPSWEAEFLFERSEITCIELNKEKCEKLKEFKKPLNIIHGDFLNIEFDTKFDVIIAAPPFNNNIDVEHIQKMYSVLNKNGVLISLTSPYWLTNNEPHQILFREFLRDKSHSLEMLPDMTFIEKGKTVHTSILILKK